MRGKYNWLIRLLVFLVMGNLLAALAASFLIVESPLDKADAIVVLSGSAAYVERADEAASLFRKGVSPKILLTNDGLQGGWNETEKRNPYFFELTRWELMRKGVPETSIEVVATPVQGTYGEAEEVLRGVLQQKMKFILIVTSPYHTRRAIWTYERVNSKNNSQVTIGIKAASDFQQSPAWYGWWLSITGWRTIPTEYVKFAYYKMCY
jgi:uncharacterized SAM-binding protein YcdF (DUF218 family)